MAHEIPETSEGCKSFPAVEYEESYPVDEDFAEITALDPPLSFTAAADWLLSELPRASENMPCFCDLVRAKDRFTKKSIIRIRFSTGGWSGAESILSLIERRVDLSYHMESWRRGGHYVFEVPAPDRPARPISEIRAQAWATRRAKYGEKGHR